MIAVCWTLRVQGLGLQVSNGLRIGLGLKDAKGDELRPRIEVGGFGFRCYKARLYKRAGPLTPRLL